VLSSIKMSFKDGMLNYPEELKEAFLESGGLKLMDGTYVSAEEIWDFMTKEAPRRFPFLYTVVPHAVFFYRIYHYVEFLWPIKYRYLLLSLHDRIVKARAKGTPLVFAQGGQTLEPYYVAKAIAIRPFLVQLFANCSVDGLSFKDLSLRELRNIEEGKRELSPDVCNIIGAHNLIKRGATPVDLVAPYALVRCSDMCYVVESHRSSARNTPIFLVDFPTNARPDQEWPVEYVAKSIRGLVKKVVEVGGKAPSDEDWKATIRLFNRGRQAARNFVWTWWGARRIPTYGDDLLGITRMANDMTADPVAVVQILEEANKELKERVDKNIKGIEIAEKPVRLFACGTCFYPPTERIEKAGGAIVGYDDWWGRILVDVEEEGDPYVNLAKASLRFSYEQSTEERAHWTAGQAKKCGARGMINQYNWGCSLQAASARMVNEIVKKEIGIPSLDLEMESLGRPELLEQYINRVESFIEMLS